ncbi:trypsin-like peptidase domain-containing protein [Streptomyces sp. MS1.HAVA.3]|uniref:Trypsin-like peptidase domain-containing protein n=1 Tax=Streptomyces caledonius TaxID=3134107 RepID=A0ABU8UA81_9ACTN
MSAHINLFAASALLVSMSGATGATASEPTPGDREQAKSAVVLVMSNSASGTGFVYDAGGGLIATTAYVIAGESGLKVAVAGGAPVSARLLGSDLCQDLAVLKLTAPQTGLKGLRLGDSDLLFAGDPITSLGYPDGGSPGADVVAVSGAAYEPAGAVRHLSTPDYPSLIHHSVATKPGDTGGPVLNKDGEVVGVNTGTWIDERHPAGEDRRVAEAISSNQAKSELPGLAAGSTKNDPGWWLGAVSDPTFPQQAVSAEIDKSALQAAHKRLQSEGTDGLFVFDVRKGSPAEKAGIRQGAVITTVNGEGVSSVPELCDILEPASPASG